MKTKNWMKKNSFKSKSIRLLCKGFRVKPRTVANWFNVSVTTIYRHLDNNKQDYGTVNNKIT